MTRPAGAAAEADLGAWVEIGFTGLALVVLGFAMRELIALRRDRRRSRADKDSNTRG